MVFEKKKSWPQRILSLPVEIVVAIYIVVDGIVAPLFRPLMRYLSSLRLIRRLEAAIAALPPYVILVLLVVPFAFAELAKVYAVLLMAEEHFRIGVSIFIAAYVVSILVCERIFHAGRAQLLTIGWFKVIFDWLMALKAKILGWFRTTRVWRLAASLLERTGVAIWRLRQWLHATFSARPKLERR